VVFQTLLQLRRHFGNDMGASSCLLIPNAAYFPETSSFIAMPMASGAGVRRAIDMCIFHRKFKEFLRIMCLLTKTTSGKQQRKINTFMQV